MRLPATIINDQYVGGISTWMKLVAGTTAKLDVH